MASVELSRADLVRMLQLVNLEFQKAEPTPFDIDLFQKLDGARQETEKSEATVSGRPR